MCPSDQGEIVEAIIAVVEKDSATETIRRMDALNKKACACVRKPSENVDIFVERFVANAQAYLNLTNGDLESAESQNFEMLLLSNAHVPPFTFTANMNNLVQSSNKKDYESAGSFPLDYKRTEKIMGILQGVCDSANVSNVSAQALLDVLGAATCRISACISDSALTS